MPLALLALLALLERRVLMARRGRRGLRELMARMVLMGPRGRKALLGLLVRLVLRALLGLRVRRGQRVRMALRALRARKGLLVSMVCRSRRRMLRRRLRRLARCGGIRRLVAPTSITRMGTVASGWSSVLLGRLLV